MEMKYRNMVFNYEQIIDEKTFTIPNYQRGIAWKKNKKQNFIETLINGEPFGTVLIYRDNKNMYLIDGLQRINTIREFNSNKYRYLKEYIIDDNEYKKYVNSIKKAYKSYGKKIDKIKSLISDDKKVKKTIIEKIIKNDGDVEKTYYALKKRFDMLSFQDKECVEFKQSIKDILKIIDKKCNIKTIKIYALEYTGEVERLPEIFYNLNTGGVALSKYDVLPSLWNDIKYQINDEEILNIVFERYNSLKNSSQFNIVISKKSLKNDGITLFEYCYALGRILYKPEYRFRSFIGEGNDSVEPIIFSILALLLGLKENQTSEIGKKLKNVKIKFLKDLKKIIIEGFSVMRDGLYEYIKSERITDKTQESYNNISSNYMIYHMFIAYIRKNYTIDVKHSEITKNTHSGLSSWNKKYVQNLHLHYFYDYIRGYWGEHRQVSDLMDEINNDNSLFRYSYTIPDSDWKEAFRQLKNEQMEYGSNSFHPKTKLFLDYLIKFKIKDNPLLRLHFQKPKTKEPFSIDYEHIIPLEKFDERGINGAPKYSLGNACFLTSNVNRGKGGDTLYEQVKKTPGLTVDTAFLEFVDYPKEKDISFVEENRDSFLEKYKMFISNRIDELINEFMQYKI